MIAIGSDHGGYKLKEEIKRYLEEKEIEYIDCGTFSEESVDYPEIAKAIALEVQSKECDKGIAICRSGIGMSITANLDMIGLLMFSLSFAVAIGYTPFVGIMHSM